MPTPPTVNLGSGIDTNQTIQQLMQLERAPLRRLERENRDYQSRIEAWESLRRRTQALEQKSRDLYSFAGPFGRRQVTSSNPQVISGEASPSAKSGSWELELLQMASTHEIQSAPIEGALSLPAGSFHISVGKERRTISFSGGNLEKLAQQINAKGEGLYQSSILDTGQGKQVVTINSLESGAEGRLRFEDRQGLLQRIGLLEQRDLNILLPFIAAKIQAEPNGDPNVDNVEYELLERDKALRLKAGTVRQNLDGRRWSSLEGARPDSALLRMELEPLDAPQRERQREAQRGRQRESQRELPTITERITVGPDISVQVGDTTLQGANIERRRQVAVKAGASNREGNMAREGEREGRIDDRIDDRTDDSIEVMLAVIYSENGQEQRQLYKRRLSVRQGRQSWQIPLPPLLSKEKRPSALLFSTDGELLVRDLLVTSLLPPEPAQEKSPAQDARLRLNGTEIRRSHNGPITDIAEGVALDLHRPGGPLKLEVQASKEAILKELQAWVDAYNEVVSYLRANSEASIQNERAEIAPPLPGNAPGSSQPTPFFAGDSTTRQLLYSLSTTVTQSYPALRGQSYKLLAQVGISSGKPGSNWRDIRSGLLKIEKARLEEALGNDAEAVRYLIASDSDKRPGFDNGAVFKMESILKSYNQQSGGLIANRIELLKSSISSNRREIGRRELSLERKEQNLRERFGRMERSLQKNRRLQQQLRQGSSPQAPP